MASCDKLAVLKNSRAIHAIRKEGKSFSNQYFVLVTKRNDTDQPGYAIIASRTVGGAVERNRCKRRLRSRVIMLNPRIARDRDFVLIARPDLLTVDSAALDKSFNRLFEIAGLIQADE